MGVGSQLELYIMELGGLGTQIPIEGLGPGNQEGTLRLNFVRTKLDGLQDTLEICGAQLVFLAGMTQIKVLSWGVLHERLHRIIAHGYTPFGANDLRHQAADS